MTVKVYTANICGSQEVRKQQQRVLFILSTLPFDMEIVDITEPGRENDREFMQEEVKKHNKKHLLPPQIFNGDTYCGDYDDFQLAADDDVIMSFLKLEEPPSGKKVSNGDVAVTQNGITHESDKAEDQPAENETTMQSAEETGEKTVPPENSVSENVTEAAADKKAESEEEESSEEESE